MTPTNKLPLRSYISSKPWLLAILLILSFSPLSAQDLFEYVKYGNHRIGFNSIIVTDDSRTWNDSLNLNRDIQIQMWFPINDTDHKPFQYSDYFKYVGKQDNYQAVTNPVARGEQIHFYAPRYYDADSTGLENLKNWRMRAGYSTKFPKKAYPTVFFSQGASGHPINNVALFELLASHGYVVVSFPTQQVDYKTTYRDDLEMGLWHQGEDMKFVYNYVNVHYQMISDTDQHFIGISSGAVAVYYTVRDLGLDPTSIISLDGSITATIMEEFIQGFETPPFDSPTLITARDYEGVNYAILDKPSTKPFKTLLFYNLRHADFSSVPVLYRIVDNFYGPAPEGFIESYEYLVAEILQFISNNHIDNSVTVAPDKVKLYKEE